MTSDHLYILMEMAVRGAMGDSSLDASGPTGPPERRRGFPRWAVTHLEEDFLNRCSIVLLVLGRINIKMATTRGHTLISFSSRSVSTNPVAAVTRISLPA